MVSPLYITVVRGRVRGRGRLGRQPRCRHRNRNHSRSRSRSRSRSHRLASRLVPAGYLLRLTTHQTGMMSLVLLPWWHHSWSSCLLPAS